MQNRIFPISKAKNLPLRNDVAGQSRTWKMGSYQCTSKVSHITPKDEKLAASDQATQITTARQYFNDMEQRADRIASLKSSAVQYKSNPGRGTAQAFVSAYDQMRGGDQSALLNALSDLPPNVGIAAARQALADSTKRLDKLTRAYRMVAANQQRGALRYSNLIDLQDAASAITDFDQSGMSEEGLAALKEAKQIPGLFGKSDQRISQALSNAMAAQFRNFNVNTGLFNNIQNSINLLQPLDVDRMSADDRSLIAKACNATPALAPGMVAPEINLNCNRL